MWGSELPGSRLQPTPLRRGQWRRRYRLQSLNDGSFKLLLVINDVRFLTARVQPLIQGLVHFRTGQRVLDRTLQLFDGGLSRILRDEFLAVIFVVLFDLSLGR